MEDSFDGSLMTLDLSMLECPNDAKAEKLSRGDYAWDLGREEETDARKAKSWWRPWRKDDRPEVSQVIEIPHDSAVTTEKACDVGADCITPISLDEGRMRFEVPVRPVAIGLQVPSDILAPGAIPSPSHSEVTDQKAPSMVSVNASTKPFSLDPDGHRETGHSEANPTLVCAFDG